MHVADLRYCIQVDMKDIRSSAVYRSRLANILEALFQTSHGHGVGGKHQRQLPFSSARCLRCASRANSAAFSISSISTP